MAIIGIGSDLIDMRRIDKALERFGMRFVTRIFNICEQENIAQKKHKNAAYAKGFAVKEACVKALGTGFSQGISWQDIVLEHYPNGKPFIRLENKAQEFLQNLIGQDKTTHIHVTISDDYPWAQAFVVIEACKNEG